MLLEQALMYLTGREATMMKKALDWLVFHSCAVLLWISPMALMPQRVHNLNHNPASLCIGDVKSLLSITTRQNVSSPVLDTYSVRLATFSLCLTRTLIAFLAISCFFSSLSVSFKSSNWLWSLYIPEKKNLASHFYQK
jgi:hypothetical protein